MSLRTDFQKFLASGAYCTPPGKAACALLNARTLAKFRELESEGKVRMRCEPEQESYLDAYGEPEAYTDIHGRRISAEQALKELIETLDRDGVWWTCSEYFDGSKWIHADSCGMHTGYKNPLDPFENCYVIDEMQAAVEAYNNHVQQMCEAI